MISRQYQVVPQFFKSPTYCCNNQKQSEQRDVLKGRCILLNNYRWYINLHAQSFPNLVGIVPGSHPPTRRPIPKDLELAHCPMTVAKDFSQKEPPRMRGMQRCFKSQFLRPDNVTVHSPVEPIVHYVRGSNDVRENQSKTFHTSLEKGSSPKHTIMTVKIICDSSG